MKKKHLGQHFLHEKSIIDRIASSTSARAGDLVIEIGPGDGALTRFLLEKGFRVRAIEYDTDLIAPLRQRFSEYIHKGDLEILEGDVLKIAPEAASRGESYYIIANIPYYITGAIIQHFLYAPHPPIAMSLVIQREVADRIVAEDKKHSLLSLSVWLMGDPKKTMNIGRGCFVPPPEVDSALLVIAGISTDRLPQHFDTELFFRILHTGFGQKRKQLRVLLKKDFPREMFTSWAEKHNLPLEIRAEDVPLFAWKDLISMAKDASL